MRDVPADEARPGRSACAVVSLFIVLLFPLIIMKAPQPEYGPVPQQSPCSTKEQERAFDTSRLEVDALRAMLSLPPQAERQERRKADPEQPTR